MEKKHTFAFTQQEVNGHLGVRLSSGIDCEIELEQAAFFGIVGIHS